MSTEGRSGMTTWTEDWASRGACRTSDPDSLFVQGGVGGYMATWYELVELER